MEAVLVKKKNQVSVERKASDTTANMIRSKHRPRRGERDRQSEPKIYLKEGIVA